MRWQSGADMEAEATSHGAVLGLALENLANFHGFPFPLGSFGVGQSRDRENYYGGYRRPDMDGRGKQTIYIDPVITLVPI